MARLEAICVLLAYANHHNILLYQMDVKSAFLNGKIEEEVYVAQPPGFEDPKHPDMVYKLNMHCMASNKPLVLGMTHSKTS